ncbi:MAG: beta-propeller fold lactonase family protein [Burkholderiaceae bacterium]
MAWIDTFGRWIRIVALGSLPLLASCGGGGGGSIVGFTISVTVNGLSGSGLVLRVNSIQSLSVAANGTVTFASPLPTGASYVVTVASTPSTPAQFCSVTNGTGTIANANVTNVAVSCSNVVTAAYVVNLGSNTVSQFTVAADGNLSPMTPATVATGNDPSGIALDPLGRYAYVANDDGSVSQFTIAADGRLSPMFPAAVLAGLNPTGITVSPSGANAYVTNEDGSVSQFTIGATGQLTAMTPASVLAGPSPASIVIDPTGRYAYVANSTGNTISQYTLAADGSLTPMAIPSVLAGLTPVSVAVDATGQYLYATNFDGGTVSNFRIGAGGGLVAQGAATVAGIQPLGLATHPDGRKAYVANFGGNEIVFMDGSASGALVRATAPNNSFVTGPIALAIDRTGRFAYASSSNNTVLRYTIDADGRLTAPTVTVAGGLFPVAIALR